MEGWGWGRNTGLQKALILLTQIGVFHNFLNFQDFFATDFVQDCSFDKAVNDLNVNVAANLKRYRL